MDIKSIQQIVDEFKNEYAKAIKEGGHNASGNLANTAKSIVNWNGERLVVGLDLADYFFILEDGRKAGKMPPISAIEKWITVKPVLPTPDKNGKLPTTHQLAFLIARSIGKNGALCKDGQRITLPKPLENTMKQFNLADKLKKALLDEIIKEFLNNTNSK